MIDHHDDLHLAVEFLNRAAVMRDELGIAIYRRAMHQALVTLGDTVIAEAERMAGASARARAPSATVVPFGRTSRATRRQGDAVDPEGAKRRAKWNKSFRRTNLINRATSSCRAGPEEHLIGFEFV